MNPEIVKKWTGALRSGKYAQGKGNLRADNGGGPEYCCLGVLLEELSEFKYQEDEGYMSADPDILEHYEEHYETVLWTGTREILIEDEELPQYILDWLGMTMHTQEKFINMNDKLGNNFDEIADEIEATYAVDR